MTRTEWPVVVCVAALTLFPSISGAQSPATSFEELRPLLPPGQEVIVRHADGRRTRERVLEVSASSLDMQSKSMNRRRALGPRTSYAESAITSIKRVDSVWQGLVIGSAAGVGWSWTPVQQARLLRLVHCVFWRPFRWLHWGDGGRAHQEDGVSERDCWNPWSHDDDRRPHACREEHRSIGQYEILTTSADASVRTAGYTPAQKRRCVLVRGGGAFARPYTYTEVQRNTTSMPPTGFSPTSIRLSPRSRDHHRLDIHTRT